MQEAVHEVTQEAYYERTEEACKKHGPAEEAVEERLQALEDSVWVNPEYVEGGVYGHES